MADTVSTAYDLNLDGQYYDGDTRRIKVKNPKEQDEATWRAQINELGDYIAEKQFLIGDKNAGKFEKFNAANIVWKQTIKFDLTGALPTPSVTPNEFDMSSKESDTAIVSNGTPSEVNIYYADSDWNPTSNPTGKSVRGEISGNTITFIVSGGQEPTDEKAIAFISLSNSTTVLQVKLYGLIPTP